MRQANAVLACSYRIGRHAVDVEEVRHIHRAVGIAPSPIVEILPLGRPCAAAQDAHVVGNGWRQIPQRLQIEHRRRLAGRCHEPPVALAVGIGRHEHAPQPAIVVTCIRLPLVVLHPSGFVEPVPAGRSAALANTDRPSPFHANRHGILADGVVNLGNGAGEPGLHEMAGLNIAPEDGGRHTLGTHVDGKRHGAHHHERQESQHDQQRAAAAILRGGATFCLAD